MRRRTAYLPTPSLRTVSLGVAAPRRVVAVDVQPVTLPSLDDAEAPVALSVSEGATGGRRDYRLFDGRLWTALGGAAGWTPDEAPARIVEAVRAHLAGRRDSVRDLGFLDACLEGGGDLENLEDHADHEVAREGDDLHVRALKHAEARMAVIGGRLHHETPEPTFHADDPQGGGRMGIDVVERRWQDANADGVAAFPGRPESPWFTFAAHQGQLALDVVSALARTCRRDPGEIVMSGALDFHDAAMAGVGVPGHVVNGHKAARVDGVLAMAADAIGHADDGSVMAWMELRNAAAALGPDRSASAMAGASAHSVARLGTALGTFANALVERGRMGGRTVALYRAATISTHRDRHEAIASRG